MTQAGYSKTIVNIMLGWLKGLASWVLRLFNLSGGISPLRFLANSWLELLVLFLLIGLAADLVIWLIRWRPHWVWLRKKRVIINDRNFFAGENEMDDEDEWQLPPEFARIERANKRRRNWQDNDFVVAGAARRNRERREREESMRRRERDGQTSPRPLSKGSAVETKDVFRDGLFDLNAKQRFSDRYEDEVFSVSNLPQPEEGGAQQPPRPERARAGASRNGRNMPRRGGARPPVVPRKGQPRRVSANKR